MRAEAAQEISVFHLRDTPRICGPGKTILETIGRNPDPDIRYEVGVFGDGDANPFVQEARKLAPTLCLPEQKALLPLAAIRLAAKLRDGGFDLLHSHDFKSDVVSLAAGRLARVPVITTVHGFIGIDKKSRAYVRANVACLRRMETVIAVSEAMRRDLEREGIASERLAVVRNCIVMPNYPFGQRSDSIRRERGLAPEHLVVGCIGRLSAEKGQRLLVDVFPEVLRAVPSARLVIAGSGPDQPLLEKRVAALGIGNAVHFLGHRSDILDVYGSLDLLVLSSDTEGLPNVVLEAMALGVPVVATAVGGTPELVIDGRTGWLVAPGAPGPLGQAIIEALTAPEDATTRAAAARHLVETEFDMTGLIRRTHELYRRFLARKRR